MRFLKLALISLVAFSLLLTLFSLLFPSQIRISKAIDLAAKPEAIRPLLEDPAQWRSWYPGADSAELILEGGKAVGFRNSDGTELRLIAVTDSTVLAENKAPRKRRGKTGWYLIPAADGRVTTLQWYNDFYLRWYPWEKFGAILLEGRYGPLMEQGLARLKKRLEEGEKP